MVRKKITKKNKNFHNQQVPYQLDQNKKNKKKVIKKKMKTLMKKIVHAVVNAVSVQQDLLLIVAVNVECAIF